MHRKIRILVLTVLAVAGFSLPFGTESFSLDTDLYTVPGYQVPPNLLFILDNSSSMGIEDQEPLYNAGRTIPAPIYPGSYPTDAVYKKSSNNTWVSYKNQYSQIACLSAQECLAVDGFFNGNLNTNTTCGGGTVFLRTGNYMNYLALTLTSNQPRLGLAKGTIHSYVNSTEGINFGLMVFNGGAEKDGKGGSVIVPVTETKTAFFNGLSTISTANLVNWTPLAETLYEGMLYFKGAASYYNPGTTYATPIRYWCQKNYVVIITDGFPSYDVADDPVSPVTSVVGDYDNDGRDPGTYDLFGSHYLDDVARYAHLNDLTAAFDGVQNLKVYTIGFNPSLLALDTTLLESAAAKGGGKFKYCHNSQEFKAALQSIIEEVLESSVSFVAPAVPVSQMEKTASMDRMYLGMFKPAEKSFWSGNIKKFGIATVDNSSLGITVGDILDKNGNLAIDPSTNSIYDMDLRSDHTATSYWSTLADGANTEKGGLGEILKNRDLTLYPRQIYTYNTSVVINSDLTAGSNRFTPLNISPAMLNVATDDEKNKLINFICGYDAYDEDFDSNTTEKRDWILGAVIHSRPLVVQYTSSTIIFVGANDGMLHAFDDSDGREMWAFIPPDQLPRLKNLTGGALEFFVDGVPRVYESSTQKILVFGERRGGKQYFALDITDPLRPLWLWEISPLIADYSEMGQTWSTPGIAKIKYGTADSWSDKWVMIVGGGYDTSQDNLAAGTDTQGRAVYVIDVLNGSLIKKWQYHATDNPGMAYSIPSDVARVDTNGDGRIDRLYVGDMGGQMWRFDLMDPSPSNWTAKRIFDANDPLPSSDRRKIFYAPDVGLESDATGVDYELLIFGTGDREKPRDITVLNRLYTIKDRNPSTILKEADLEDVTSDLLQTATATAAEKQTVYSNLASKSGWFIILNSNSGEKCLAPPLLFYGISYYTTFTPQIGAPSDLCFLGQGTARLYAVDYLTGIAMFNFDLTYDGASDRSVVIGTAIPSGTIIAVVGGSSTTGYIGIGGGIYKAPLKSPKVIVPINWKQRF